MSNYDPLADLFVKEDAAPAATGPTAELPKPTSSPSSRKPAKPTAPTPVPKAKAPEPLDDEFGDRLALAPGQVVASQCLACARKAKGTSTCEAYPEGIPAEILQNKIDHAQPHEGDHGKQFVADPRSGFANPFESSRGGDQKAALIADIIAGANPKAAQAWLAADKNPNAQGTGSADADARTISADDTVATDPTPAAGQ